MREYEIMFILPAESDESVVTTAVDRITKVVTASGGEVSNIDRWGRRRFAFEVDRQTEGYYVVADFTAEPASQLELERVLNLADEVLRYKVLVVPQKRENSRPNRRDKKEAASSPAKAETA
ncbi:MAG TPA: 30S ribosomal protein S6 [Actinomycetota bacterium]